MDCHKLTVKQGLYALQSAHNGRFAKHIMEVKQMLNIYNFDVCKYGGGLAILSYYGENTGDMYHISKDGADYVVDVTMLDEYGEAQEGPRYISGSLSSAIAIIEDLENGEEV